jgi:hypothetical protein
MNANRNYWIMRNSRERRMNEQRKETEAVRSRDNESSKRQNVSSIRQSSRAPSGVGKNAMQNKSRTSAQNRSLHKWLREVATKLDDAGYEASETITIPISFTEEIVKEYMFKPVAKAMYGRKSTTALTCDEMRSVVQQMERMFAEKFGVVVPFPSKEQD